MKNYIQTSIYFRRTATYSHQMCFSISKKACDLIIADSQWWELIHCNTNSSGCDIVTLRHKDPEHKECQMLQCGSLQSGSHGFWGVEFTKRFFSSHVFSHVFSPWTPEVSLFLLTSLEVFGNMTKHVERLTTKQHSNMLGKKLQTRTFERKQHHLH